MPGIEKMNNNYTYAKLTDQIKIKYNNLLKQNENNDSNLFNKENEDFRTDSIETRQLKDGNIIYKKPVQKSSSKDKDKENIDPVRRPININSNNNVFFINYRGQNEVVKIDPGEYTLTELSSEVQNKVNESYGIGKIKVDLTGSGSDRLIQAKDAKINDYLNNND